MRRRLPRTMGVVEKGRAVGIEFRIEDVVVGANAASEGRRDVDRGVRLTSGV